MSKYLFTPKDPLIVDKIGLPESFLNWITVTLDGYDTSMVEWFKLLPRKKQMYNGRVDHPVRVKKGSRSFKRGYRIRNSVITDHNKFPYTHKLEIGTESWEDDDKMGYWQYVYQQETFHNYLELLAFLCGHEIYHWLRHSKQIGGRNVETHANVFGLVMCHGWRKWIRVAPELDHRVHKHQCVVAAGYQQLNSI